LQATSYFTLGQNKCRRYIPGMNRLKAAWQLWKRVGQAIGDFIARIVLTIFYFTIFAPFGLIVRLFNDPLDMKREVQGVWIERATQDHEIQDARRLY
jgi:hypothetical protein